jgi:hypothetical protein
MCATCGTQFAESDSPPAECPICEDERQYVPATGQQWTTLEALQETSHSRYETLEAGLTAIGSDPKFGIGQHAILVQSAQGNILWDCISLINDKMVAKVDEMGGISAIAISHPHYYSSMVEWSRAFDAPIYIHADERQWVMRPDPAITYWEGETYALADGFTLIRCGGHYSGGQVLHYGAGAEGRGALLVGDILQVTQDRKFVSFMYSYPNMIPLPASKVRHIGAAVEPFAFERLYSPWWGLMIREQAKDVVRRSVARYIAAISE